MGFADPGRTDKKHVFAFAQVGSGGQFEDLPAFDGGIEVPVEVFEGFQSAKIGGFGAPCHHPVVAHVEFILEDEFQKFGVAESVGGRFLEARGQTLHQAGETQLTQGGLELAHGC